MNERHVPIFNSANILTLFRVALVPVFVVLLLKDTLPSTAAALAVYFIASLTDYLDGIIARGRGLQTPFGEFLDPLADKLLVGGAFISLTTIPGLGIPLWIVSIILAREVTITAMRIAALRRDVPMKTELSGKVKTFFQMGSLHIILIMIVLQRAILGGAPLTDTRFWVTRYGNLFGNVLQILPPVLVGISALLALLSMVQYIFKNRHIFTPSARLDPIVGAVTSGLFIGYVKRGSGTMASMVACGIWVFTSSSRFYPIIVLVATTLGFLMSGYAERRVFGEPDSSKIVIDEMSGMLLTYLSFSFSWNLKGLIYGMVGFLLFRTFDILKPTPLSSLQRIRGGPGIMLDDIAAGVLSNGLLQLMRLLVFQ
jgi:CDP-diacylglycerol--glycerol-3-phosphate 3-phosphatidyltransferase